MIEHTHLGVRGRSDPVRLRNVRRVLWVFASLGPAFVVFCLLMYFSRKQHTFLYLGLFWFLVTLLIEGTTFPYLFLKPEELTAGGGRIVVTRPGALFSRPLDLTLERDRIGRCVYHGKHILPFLRFVDTDGRPCSPRIPTLLTRSELAEIFSNVDLPLVRRS